MRQGEISENAGDPVEDLHAAEEGDLDRRGEDHDETAEQDALDQALGAAFLHGYIIARCRCIARVQTKKLSLVTCCGT